MELVVEVNGDCDGFDSQDLDLGRIIDLEFGSMCLLSL